MEMRIGLMGVPIKSGNMGCMALTYSLLSILEIIRKKNNLDLNYLFFDGAENEEDIRKIAEYFEIPFSKIHSGQMLLLKGPTYVLPRLHRYLRMKKDVQSCDVLIDMTGGDSFTDIYGTDRFLGRTKAKYQISKWGVPIALGPQTYGPFKSKNTQLVRSTINCMDLVMARDKISATYVENNTDKKCITTTDLAFNLPYKKSGVFAKDKRIKVGINVSGMLYENGMENVSLNNKLRTNYRKYIETIIDWTIKHDKFSVYLIPHVQNDLLAINRIANQHKGKVHVVDMQSTPMELKSIISEMDIFIGARMHATIAAFTSGVPCIPVAYSRKFKGVFELVEYPVLVDLEELETKEAITTTVNYFENIDQIKIQQKLSIEKSKKYNDIAEQSLTSWIMKYYFENEERTGQC